MQVSRRLKVANSNSEALVDILTETGLPSRIAAYFKDLPHKIVHADPRRPFREPGASRDEVIFVHSGILCKYKMDSGGRRQIVALRFRGEGILPREGAAQYGIQAIVRTELVIASAEDFTPILEAHPDLQRYFWRLIQRNESISYEWLINCGRRDSVARVAHLLCETAVRSGGSEERGGMTNPFTQQQIADITGQTSVNVNRVFADLEGQGLIERKGREIRFRDWPEMLRVASFQPSYLE